MLWLIGLLLLKVPLAPLWALIAGLMTLYPNIGGVIALLGPAFSILVSKPDMYRLCFLLGMYAVIVVIDQLMLQPLIMKRVTRVPVWASILVPIVLGIVIPFWGILLAPPLLAVVYGFPPPAATLAAVAEPYHTLCRFPQGWVREVKISVRIPVAVKVSPFFSNMANMAKRLDEAGANGLVLFNRFYQPDINLDELEIQPNVLLSTPQDLRLPLTWIGILYGRVRSSLAATSGVHGPEDVVKLLMVGADATMLCSALLKNGIYYLRQVEAGLAEWMDKHEYESVAQMKGSMSQIRCPNPSAFERAQYMKAVKSMQHVQLTSREAWRILSGD